MAPITSLLLSTFALLATTTYAYPQPYPSNPQTPPPPPAPPANNDDLVATLLTRSTAIKKFQTLLTEDGKKLKSPEDIKKATVFDFNNAQPAPGAKGGAAKAANIDTFPILTGLGLGTTVAFLTPCGINTPHIHPRASEFLTVVRGTVDFGMILENGLVAAGENAEISGRLGEFQGTVFPQGSIHYQINPTCDDAIFVATLNSEDPGTSQVAQNFFGLNSDVVNATLGFPETLDGKKIEEFRGQIPANLAQAVDTCLKSCGY